MPEEGSRTLLSAIDAASRELSRPEATDLTQALITSLCSGPSLACGIWLSHDGELTPHAWQAAPACPLDEPAARAALGKSSPEPVQQAVAGVALAAVPLDGGVTARGVVGIVTGEPLAATELTALAILGRLAGTRFASRVRSDIQSGAMTEFVALITHELRSPLTALRGNVQLAEMATRKGDIDRARNRLEAALKGVDAITYLIQNLQDVSHLQRGKFQLNTVAAALGPTVERAARRAERMVELERQTIEIEAAPLVVEHDRVHLEQALFNILLNALQFSRGGAVAVSVEQADDEAVVTVVDHGIGIPPEEMSRIFEPYFRGPTGATVHAKGMGLGLTVSRATIERHGGSIELLSRPGEGSTVVIHLPLAPVA